MEESELGARVPPVAEFGADVLICGAISRPLDAMLSSAGVEVIPQTCGPVEDVLKAFISGRLTEQPFELDGLVHWHVELVGRGSTGNSNPRAKALKGDDSDATW